METKVRKIKVAKAKRRREEGEKGKEVRKEEIEEERKKEKTKKEKINRSEKSSRRIGNLGWEWSSKIRGRSKNIGIRTISWIDTYIWKESK